MSAFVDTSVKSSQVPATLGTKTAANSMSLVIASDDAILGAVNETAPASDTASSGHNGRLQRIAQNLTANGVLAGAVNETAPASDTASSGLNGRMQRLAQRVTSLIALYPSSLGAKTAANSFAVTLASDDVSIPLFGAVNETAPASDTASSGINGRMQRVAQRLTSLIALVPSSLGAKTAANSLAVTIATDDVTVPLFGGVTETAPASDTASSGLNGRLQRVAQNVTTLNSKFTATAAADANRLPVDPRDALSIGTFNTSSAATIFTQDITGYGSITVQVTSAGTTCTITYECSEDNSTWVGCAGLSVNGASTQATTSTVTGVYHFSRRTRYFRARVSTYTSGTVTTVVYAHVVQPAHVLNAQTTQGIAASGATNTGNPIKFGFLASSSAPTTLTTGQLSEGLGTLDKRPVFRPHCIPEVQWSYAAATSGIVNTTTAVTINSAPGAGLRAYITSIQIMAEALGTATELAIRDGAGGTVIWKTKIGTGGQSQVNVIFEGTLRQPTTATLLEVVTLTASGTGAVYFNAQGYLAP